MNDKLSAEAVLEDQELVAKFLKETTLFLGPDQEIMQSHDIMPPQVQNGGTLLPGSIQPRVF